MADDFPVDTAEIVALFLESVFFGVYLVTFGMVMNVLLIKRSSRGSVGQYWVLLAVVLALFIFATLDEAILVRHVLEAFIWYKGPGGAIADFSNVAYWEGVMKTVTYSAQTSIADAMLIYRCFIVYNRNWWIVLALGIMWAAGVAVESYSTFLEATFRAGSALVSSNVLQPWLTSLFSISLSLNLIATSLIIVRIYRIQRRNNEIFVSNGYGKKGGSGLKRAMRTIIESGAMYSFSVVILIAVYIANNNALYGVSDAIVQIIGISFNLIIIRISQGQSIENTTQIASGTLTSADGSRNKGRDPKPSQFHLRAARGDGLSYMDDIRTADLTTGVRSEGAIVVQFGQERATGRKYSAQLESMNKPDDMELVQIGGSHAIEKV